MLEVVPPPMDIIVFHITGNRGDVVSTWNNGGNVNMEVYIWGCFVNAYIDRKKNKFGNVKCSYVPLGRGESGVGLRKG
jgi:hypothetical protein